MAAHTARFGIGRRSYLLGRFGSAVVKLPTWLSPRSKPDPFVTELLGQTHQLVMGADAVLEYMNSPTKEQALRVRAIEHQADALRRGLISHIKRAFITPIDREDLFGLSRAIDDVLDYLYSTTREMYLLKVAPNDHLKGMVSVLRECARELHGAVRSLQAQPEAAGKHAVRVLVLENRMDSLYITALADLFDNVVSPDDVVHVLKLREIYRHMIHAANSAEQAANLINDILVKFH
jgi:predicted phosphate transport protein (TIGR00153 family)